MLFPKSVELSGKDLTDDDSFLFARYNLSKAAEMSALVNKRADRTRSLLRHGWEVDFPSDDRRVYPVDFDRPFGTRRRRPA